VDEFRTIKKIDNSRRVRPTAKNTTREWARVVAFGAVLTAGGLLYAWQHFQCLQLGYQLEELKAERGQAAELNSQLKLEAAALKSPMRIDAIARRQLGLTIPVPGQSGPAPAAEEGVLAQVRRSSASSTR
jgi:cell division protein FtsL